MLKLLLVCQIAYSALALEVTPSKISDGPYIFYQDTGEIENVSVEAGKLITTTIPAPDGIAEIQTTIPSVPIISIAPALQYVPADTVEMPPKLLAVSDIEGNLDHLLHFLQLHNIIDESYNWKWGTNHVLFNGDSVDRGEQVTELLWFIRKLQQQAKEAGGQVHLVLGNHDIMIMADDIRYTHPKYKVVVEKTGIPYHQLFGDKSVLGKWLRNQNSIVQIGPYIFVHAGYSPELNELNVSLTEINNAIRNSIGPPAWPNRDDLASSLAWHSKGPLWYRGYFEKHAKKYGPKPTAGELQAILERHNAKVVIVGHTVTGEVGYLDGNKSLIGIDVHWDTEGEGLLATNGELVRLTMNGSSRKLGNISTTKADHVTQVPPVRGISPTELQELLDHQTIVLVDVRELDEFEEIRIPGALNFPLSTLTTKSIRKIANGKEVVFQCHSGNRSAIAAKEFFDGKQSQKHLQGGIIAWKKEGFKTTSK